ncbi:transglycosylase SLT domain-containing protein [Streptomyces sp. SS1-1]|uniref:transglycosylase SLT domain-containing protein n=1 Tax=unclassified Streptomyces TaxID=2593676 RepID=UPI0012500FDD|nr:MULTISPECIES: LysM peptidoglycan-binding domain-containing protein [unclassified Streptomyces]KAB2974181.1 transglycosylase SLT domain-containing protein [Streptomyces sp. SS1-1]MDI9831865.1 LysM peptidoglycan-binding domain-containing protein [Streptomyces sp. KAU_LT]
MSRGKHRRTRTSPFTRRVIAAGTGTAALALPLLSATTASAAEPAKAPTVAKVGSVSYTTKKGDTLYGIADRYDAQGGWRQLYKDNRAAIGDNPRLIHPGVDLKVRATKKAAPAKAKANTASAPVKKSAVAQATQASVKTYADNLDGWIREALDIMAQKGIPGSYEGIHRNVMRESSGNPAAINNWDSNAVAGTPSKGLLQVIDPTFATYHVPGTAYDPFDPVANITAACNYAAARYGSIDNVNGPY